MNFIFYFLFYFFTIILNPDEFYSSAEVCLQVRLHVISRNHGMRLESG